MHIYATSRIFIISRHILIIFLQSTSFPSSTHIANLSPIMSEENTKEVSSKSAVAEDSSGNNKKIKTSGQMSEMLSIYQDYSEVR